MLSPQYCLVLGIILSFFLVKKSHQDLAKKRSSQLLQVSIILLGASLNFYSVLAQGISGVVVTFISILTVFILGYAGYKILKVDPKQGLLITIGTAICGGSAIGALAPVIQAESLAITVSIGIVFLLNALAVFIFPPLGHFFELDQSQFGYWAALAIHDTSSVVAASSIYGEEALKVATTVKLIRALWIIPVTLCFSIFSKNTDKKITIPWFVFGFLVVSILFTFTDFLAPYKDLVTVLAKNGFAITLFLIGLTFNFSQVKKVGVRPLALGIGLWIVVSSLSLIYIKYN